MYIVEILTRIIVQFGAIIRSIASKHNLTFSQATTLLSIPYDGITISSLANQLGLDISTLSRNINNLERKKLVLKKADLNDARIILVTLSKEGVKMVKNFEDDLTNENFNILQHISLGHQQKLLNHLEKLSWAINCHRNI